MPSRACGSTSVSKGIGRPSSWPSRDTRAQAVIDHGLLTPGAHRAEPVAGDEALVDAMVQTELAWLRALATCDVLKADEADEAASALNGWRPDLDQLARDGEASGNVVVPLVSALRDRLSDKRTAALLHRGLTSQDVLDTALMLLARKAL